ILGDNLEILKSIEADSIDLIYLDPPFFSNRNYEVIWGDAGEIRSFQDRWSGGIDHYIGWLKERVEEMYRVLKPTGSLFLHCDWHANAYIRTDILDKIFGMNNFRNEIIWKRKTGRGETNHKSNKFGTETDTIFFYTKNNANVFNTQFSFASESYNEYVNKFFKHTDEQGRKYRIDNLASPTLRPNLIYDYKGYKPPQNGWAISQEKMEQFDKEDRLHFPKDHNGRIQRRRFLDELQGKPIQNMWDDIEMVNFHSKEKIGYPTQKPEALLDRIIKCASNEGDTVLDPFMGGGTAIAVADKLNRRWLGIDQSAMAVKVTELRLQKQQDLFSAPYTVQLHKYDYDTLRYKDAFAFEAWIVRQFGGTPNAKQRGDRGLDGKAADGAPIQVKRSDNIGRGVIDNFKSAAERFDKNLFDKNIAAQKPIGYIIAFSFGKGAVEEVARLKNKEDRIIRLVTVESIVPIAVKPAIGVHISELGKDEKGVRRIEFAATGESPAGIEFYSWDFAYDAEKGFKPEVFIDKEGKQIYSCKAGLYHIAVKVVDNDGLENIETIKLKINGKIERE
uniref:site-specific DNA-methyltransferase n=1 Tax=Treponema endosymbiont of Eucomonympha sp. TaxID=1580831 RepID=UPI000A4C08C6